MITTQAKQTEFAGVRAAAQIFNLPSRRFALGRAREFSNAFHTSDGLQNAILRYGRLQICATACASLALVLLPFNFSLRAASFSEPETVFYGKIFTTGGGHPYLLTEGQLTWIIQRADGNNLVLGAQLKSLNTGEYSYRLNVPHEALALGLQSGGGGVPLSGVDQTQTHLLIAVNGQTARILGPNGSTFDAAQARRTATYRLDLLVRSGSADVDGNGLPDWWELKHGLNNPNGDDDGDGWNNLAEFRNGTNPKHDDRVPSLATREIRAYADGTTLVLLRAIDSDSQPSNLTYTVTRGPETGALFLRNGSPGAANPDAPLAEGATFSQSDVNSGRVVFTHANGGDVFDTSFGLSLRDETPAHPASTNLVFVNFYKPGRTVAVADLMDASLATPVQGPDVAGFVPDEQRFVMSYLLSRDLAYVVADGSSEMSGVNIALPSSGLSAGQYTNQYVPGHGRDRHHVLLGGLGDDHLVGGMEGDVLIGGPGNDLLRGNGGPDLFLLTGRDDGNDTIEDFNAGEDDRIDLSRALTGSSPWLTNYLQLTTTSSNSALRINSRGTGAPFTNLVLTLSGVVLAPSNLVSLVENGHIITGDKGYTPRVTIAATIPVASENGPTSGRFTLARTGTSRDALTVNLQITGSAGNGVDYWYLPPQATFLAGQRTVVLDVIPYVDSITELNEIADIVVLAGAGYEMGAASHAQVTIEDLMPRIIIEALEPLAIKADQTPGYFLVTRDGILDRSVFVQLTVGGTAANNSDYQSIPAFVNLAPYQTTALIPVTPKATAVLSNGLEYVQITVKTNTAYKVGSPSVARVLIVEEQLTFDLWHNRYFGGGNPDMTAFGDEDPGHKGIRNLHRYAFGLNPTTPQLSKGAPEFKLNGGRLQVAFRKPISVTQVQYIVEVSDDLVTWHSGDAWWEPYAAPEYSNQLETVCYRARQSMSDTPQLFMRVRVVYAP